MSTPQYLQKTSFNAGELTPRLYARVDQAKFDSGCRILENFLVEPHGGATRRPGTAFIAEAKDSSKPLRLQRFEFAANQAYVLAFGEKTLRFFMNQAAIPVPSVDAGGVANGTFDADISGWTDRSTGGGSLAWNAAGALNLVSDGTNTAHAEQALATNSPGKVHVLSLRVLAGPVLLSLGASSLGTDLLTGNKPRSLDAGWHTVEFTPTTGTYYLGLRNARDATCTVDDVFLLNNAAAAVANGAFDAGISGWTDRSTGGGAIAWNAAKAALDLVPGAGIARVEQSISVTCGPTPLVVSVRVLAGALALRLGSASLGRDVLAERVLGSGRHLIEFTPPANGIFFLGLAGADAATCTVDEVTLECEAPLEIATEWLAADAFGLNFTQSADVLFVAHQNYAFSRVSRAGHRSWSVTPMRFGASVAIPTGLAATLTGTGSAKTHAYTVTAIQEGLESEQGVSASAQGPAALESVNYVTLAWTAVPDAERYNVYKNYNGVFYYIGQAAALTSPSFVDNGITPDHAATAPIHCDYFSGGANRPAVVSFHQQRLALGRTSANPQTIWMSKIGDYGNFNKCLPLRDDDRCIYSLDSDEVNAIQWIVSGRWLFLGTSGAEWCMGAASGEAAALTPTDVQARRVVSHGSEPIQPVSVGEIVLYVERGARRVRALSYKVIADAVQSEDLTLLADHLFRENRITQIAFAQNPSPLLLVVRDDGQLCAMSYLPGQNVVGWSRLTTNGAFESVAVINGPDRDEIWVVARRTVDGVSKRFIELFQPLFESDDPRDAFFLDAGLTYDGAILTRSRSGNTATLAMALPHGYKPGATITVQGVGAGYDGPATVAAVPAADRLSFANTGADENATACGSGAVAEALTGFPRGQGVISRARASGVATLTLRAPHGLRASDPITVSGVEDGYDGAATILALPSAIQLSYANPGPDESPVSRVASLVVASVHGLDHLEGKRVQVCADGAAHPDRVVTGGAIALDKPYAKVAVGLGYTSVFAPLALQSADSMGPGQGRAKRVSGIVLRLQRSLGVKVGPTPDALDEIPLRRANAPTGAAPELFSGDLPIRLGGSYELQGDFTIVQDKPLPLTILGMYIEATQYAR